MFDDLVARGEPLNRVVPDRVPGGSTGVIPVIARLVWPDCEEWYPGRAVRWTPAAVLVSIQVVAGDPLANKLVWLAAADVKRRHRQPRWQQNPCRPPGNPTPRSGREHEPEVMPGDPRRCGVDAGILTVGVPYLD